MFWNHNWHIWGGQRKGKNQFDHSFWHFWILGGPFWLFLDLGKFLGFVNIIFGISIHILWVALKILFLDCMACFFIKSILTFFWDTLYIVRNLSSRCASLQGVI